MTAHRLSHVARINRKRPPIRVEVERDLDQQAEQDLLDVLFEILEPIVRTGPK